MEIIVPAAGLSTRFPNTRPKYSLVDYSGTMMLKSSLIPYLDKYKIHVGILKEHDDLYNIKSFLKHEFGSSINIVVLEKPTKGPAETVHKIIKSKKIKNKTQILIKDCDSFFEHSFLEGNYICTSLYESNTLIKKPAAKSYVVSNDQNIIQNIVEKQIISNEFCVGGYAFRNVEVYNSCFDKIKNIKNELFVSNIIQAAILNKEIFISNKVNKYIDVGTAEEWFEYNDKSVIFCDIDGTIIEAQARHEYKNKPIPLFKNINIIKEKQKSGHQVIFVTSRPGMYKTETSKMLKNLGFGECELIMGLQNCKRILINDFNNANPYPRAEAINIQRNSDTLENYL